jgi:hypothetical protein
MTKTTEKQEAVGRLLCWQATSLAESRLISICLLPSAHCPPNCYLAIGYCLELGNYWLLAILYCHKATT